MQCGEAGSWLRVHPGCTCTQELGAACQRLQLSTCMHACTAAAACQGCLLMPDAQAC